MEGDAGQILHPVGERALHVLGEEEGGVAQARHHDPLHAAHDLRFRGAVRVGEGGEAGDVHVLAQRNVLLVMDEDGLQDLDGKPAEFLRDAAEHHGGPFDEVLPLREQAEIAESRPRHRRELALDDLFPPGGVQHHPLLFEVATEILEGPHAHGTPRRARGQEAMAVRRVAALDDRAALGGGLRFVDRQRNDLRVQQRHQPPDGPAERKSALAVLEPGVPTHALREGQAAEQGGDRRWQNVARVAPGRPLDVKEVELRGEGRIPGRLLELIDGHAALLRESFRRFRPVSGGILRDLCRRTPDLLLAVGLPCRDLSGDDETPRRRERLNSFRNE